MIFNLGGGGVTNANQLNYDNSKSGLESTDVQGALDEVTESLTNENSETFNFGVLNGVRGFFTNPSRADDSFIPFSKLKQKTFTIAGGRFNTTVELDSGYSTLQFTSTTGGNASAVKYFRAYSNGVLVRELQTSGDKDLSGTFTKDDDITSFNVAYSTGTDKHVSFTVTCTP